MTQRFAIRKGKAIDLGDVENTSGYMAPEQGEPTIVYRTHSGKKSREIDRVVSGGVELQRVADGVLVLTIGKAQFELGTKRNKHPVRVRRIR